MNRGTPIGAPRADINHARGGPGFGCRLLPRGDEAQARWEDAGYWLSEWEILKRDGRFPKGEAKPSKAEFDEEMPRRTKCKRLCPLWPKRKQHNLTKEQRRQKYLESGQ